MKIKHIQKIIFCITIVSVIGCFSSTKNKKEVSDDRNIFDRVGNVYFNDLLNKSAEAKKTLLLFFTAYTARSTSRMEDYIEQNKVIFQRLKNDFIFVPLHVDNREELPKKEWFYSEIMKKEIKTVGSKYLHWEMEKFETNAQPFFVIVDAKGNKIKDMIYTKDFSKINDFFLRTEH